MMITTCLVHNRCLAEFEIHYNNKEQELYKYLSSDHKSQADRESRRNMIMKAFESLYNMNTEKYQKYSAAFYDYSIQELIKTKEENNSDYLRNAIKNLDRSVMEELYERSLEQTDNSEFTVFYTDVFRIYSSDNDAGLLLLASECHPWLAAINYMKYIYLICLIMELICMAIIISILNRTEKN